VNRWGRLGALATGCVLAWLSAPAAAHAAEPAAVASATATPIKHFIYLMQGGRTFDNYFGTYPGADGFPAGTCQTLGTTTQSAACVKPYPLHGKAVPTWNYITVHARGAINWIQDGDWLRAVYR